VTAERGKQICWNCSNIYKIIEYGDSFKLSADRSPFSIHPLFWYVSCALNEYHVVKACWGNGGIVPRIL
jgi:hypothetical protein